MGFCVSKGNLIDLMMIDHPCHRQGYGKILLAHCEARMFEEFATLTLESFEPNQKANSFYRKNGWVEGNCVFDEASGVNKLIFTKHRLQHASG